MKKLLILNILFAFACEQQRAANKHEAINSNPTTYSSDTQNNYQALAAVVLPDEQTAIWYAEKELFRTYGKEQILKQRPYKVEKEKDIWTISGSLPEANSGGVFCIRLNAISGDILGMTHEK